MDLFLSGEPRWLSFQVNLPGEEEQPRVQLVSVPFALKAADAETLGGKPLSAFVLAESRARSGEPTLPESSLKDPKETAINLPTASIEGTGTTNKIAKWTNTTGTLGDSAVYESAGNVGIGTTSPANRLHVLGDGTSTALFDGGTGDSRVAINKGSAGNVASLIFTTGGAGWAELGTTQTNDLYFKANATANNYATRMFIKGSTGNVGIGTTNPGAPLHVVAPGGWGTEPIRAQSNSTFFSGADAAGTARLAINNDSGPTLNFYGYDTNWFTFMSVNETGTKSVSFTSSGHVGVGTAAPQAYQHGGANKVLEVSNSGTGLHSQSHVILSTGVSNLAGSSIGSLTWAQPNSTSSNKGVALISATAQSTNPATPAASMHFYTRNTTDTNWMERIRIDAGGNVGIGTTTPGQKLEVLGNLKVSGTAGTDGIIFPDGTKQTTACGALAFSAPGQLSTSGVHAASDATPVQISDIHVEQQRRIEHLEAEVAALKAKLEAVLQSQR
jgi:hypothetical protein